MFSSPRLRRAHVLLKRRLSHCSSKSSSPIDRMESLVLKEALEVGPPCWSRRFDRG